ncbi:haloalkane dehalogenase [Marinobacter daqiaonensis]|uniref:Haloalkane dehalogenase n=1 Tax=Marinobacter daqiaonensis TaxID=650891 RepID=A0A1I6IAP3_9GAMM|nr:haloalkane dehalogenase [Marinobacter daqiaonensis]SFR63738.1 haloalkane dehalogenase [Marinobacter daqiaonensis]
MKALRTPDSRFQNLAGFDYQPHYLNVDDFEGGELRMHYLDEGPQDGPIVLLMHGEPSWCYLYRKMIPIITAAGYRAIAPDLIGFGRSDKPADRKDYTYARHMGWMQSFLDQLDLQDIHLVCQDWGGLLGLRLVGENPDRFASVVAANTFLPTGDKDPGAAFKKWQRFSQETPEFHIAGVIKGGTVTPLPQEVMDAYNAPFPDESFKEGARQFPILVPTTPDDPAAEANRQAWKVLGQWQKPFLTAFSDSDPVTRGADRFLQKAIPGAQGQDHVTIEQGGHFLQEDQGETLAEVVVRFLDKSR